MIRNYTLAQNKQKRAASCRTQHGCLPQVPAAMEICSSRLRTASTCLTEGNVRHRAVSFPPPAVLACSTWEANTWITSQGNPCPCTCTAGTQCCCSIKPQCWGSKIKGGHGTQPQQLPCDTASLPQLSCSPKAHLVLVAH